MPRSVAIDTALDLDDGYTDRYRDIAAVTMAQHQFDGSTAPRCHLLAEQLTVALVQLRRMHVHHGHADQLLATFPQHLAGPMVDIDDHATLHITHDDGIVGVLHQRPVSRCGNVRRRQHLAVCLCHAGLRLFRLFLRHFPAGLTDRSPHST